MAGVSKGIGTISLFRFNSFLMASLRANFPYFIATASVQQLHPALLQLDTFDSKAVIVEEQEPVRVVLRVISLQLVEIEELQPASVDPAEDAKEADLVVGLICMFFLVLFLI